MAEGRREHEWAMVSVIRSDMACMFAGKKIDPADLNPIEIAKREANRATVSTTESLRAFGEGIGAGRA